MDSLAIRTPLPNSPVSKAKGPVNTKSKKPTRTSTRTKASKPAGVSKPKADVEEVKVSRKIKAKIAEAIKNVEKKV